MGGPNEAAIPDARPLAWITGAGGLIGSYLVQSAPKYAANWRVRPLTRKQLDLTDFAAVAGFFEREQPRLVIHCAAISKTPLCETDPKEAWRINVEVTERLSALAKDIPFVAFSSDLVFDGRQGNYVETDATSPLTVYGKTKVAAEQVVLKNPRHTVIRTSLNFGASPSGDRSFNEEVQRTWARGETTRLFEDEFRCPVPAEITARAVWELVEKGARGLYHLAGAERLSRLQIGQLLATRLPHLHPTIEAMSLRDYRGAPRSPDTSLDCRKAGALLSFSLPRFSAWVEERPPGGRVIVVGGGAAGIFAAITCAEAALQTEVTVLEKGPRFLSKVRISGGGRCNVTHHCFEGRELAAHFPRGARELIGTFQRFQARDTVQWFESRGVGLKTESDGRMFPVTDSSETIIECLLRAARQAGVTLRTNQGAETIQKKDDGTFVVKTSNGEELGCDKLLLATGGCRTVSAGQLAGALGHTIETPVPSLFTFHIESAWLRELAGLSLESVEASVAEARLRERGALLVTHWGLSGPVILRLSAWGARKLAESNYRFPLRINWLPHLNSEEITAELDARRKKYAARLVENTPVPPLTARLWEALVEAAGVAPETRWTALSRSAQHRLTEQLLRTEFTVTGKSLNKEEFVTCGGVSLREINFQTMESRVCPGLYFAGEILDIDGITGGFNFQAAWTTGWIAGNAMACQ